MQELSRFLVDMWAHISASTLTQSMLSACLVLMGILGTRLAGRYYRDRDMGTAEERRSAYLALRNSIVGVVLVLLLMMWGGRLQHFALSVAALAAGVAIAGKEFFMSALGSLMRVMQRQYAVGDVIEIASLRGEVIEVDFLTTRLLEQGPSGYITGRTVEFPNMFLLLNHVRKFSHTGRFLHEFVRIPIDPMDDVPAATQRLLDAGTHATAEWIDEAEDHFKRVEGAYLINLPDSKPLVLVEPVEARRVDLVLRFPCPANRRLFVSQEILRRFYGAPKPVSQNKTAV